MTAVVPLRIPGVPRLRLRHAEAVGRLEALVAAGAVDGVTAAPTLTVDAQPLAETLALLQELRELLQG